MQLEIIAKRTMPTPTQCLLLALTTLSVECDESRVPVGPLSEGCDPLTSVDLMKL